MKQGLEYRYGGGMSLVDKVHLWLGKRAQAGKLPPNGFPRNGRF
jgi:topoisomerase IV subunit A